jgi:hypothetical protein
MCLFSFLLVVSILVLVIWRLRWPSSFEFTLDHRIGKKRVNPVAKGVLQQKDPEN